MRFDRAAPDARLLAVGGSWSPRAVAYQDTIKSIHSPRFMRDPKAVEGSVEGNTVHAELLEIARMARHDFMLDVAITRDRRISGVFAR